MFALHETTQRRVCRVTFLTVCVLPTLLTLAGIAYCNRPWREHDWQRALGQELHVRAAVGDISHPQPGWTVLRNVRLGDLRTDRTLGVVDELRFHYEDSRLLLHADRVSIEAAQLPDFTAAISTWLATDVLVPFDFRADQLSVNHLSLPAVALENLVVTGDQDDAQKRRVLFQAEHAGGPLEIALQSENGAIHATLDAQQSRLPAWLIGTLVPGIGGCGMANFRGEVTIENANQRMQGEARGRLEGVNLQQWIGPASPHSIRGICEVQLERLTWSAARIEVAQGSVAAGSGAAGNSLFQALTDPRSFHCTTGPGWPTLKPTSREELIFFDQLAVGFTMTSAGITFAGECPGGALAITKGAALLFGPPQRKEHPVANLVQLFHLPRQGWLPDTRGAHGMAGGLPLPTGEDRAAESRLK